MKTHEEIKNGLECCISDTYGCYEKCPYFNSLSNGVDCALKMHADALAYINQLEARVPKWISVKDRLPNPSTYVLALTAPGALSVGQNVIVADYIHPKSEDHGVFVIAYTNYDDKDIVPVTHWMPMPEMPKDL